MSGSRRLKLVPVILAVLLLGGAAADRWSLPRPSAAAPYHQRMRAVATTLPSRAGDWIATELPAPAEAVEQLRPNLLLCRSYRNLKSGRQVQFLLVQCGDVRDLVAHYPPICYPGRGVHLVTAETRTATAGAMQLPMTRYEFQSNTFKDSKNVNVDNFMILPDGRVKPDMQGMEREIGLRNRYFGAAQVQVVSDGTMPVDQRDEAFKQIVAAYEPLIRAMSGGVER